MIEFDGFCLAGFRGGGEHLRGSYHDPRLFGYFIATD